MKFAATHSPKGENKTIYYFTYISNIILFLLHNHNFIWLTRNGFNFI